MNHWKHLHILILLVVVLVSCKEENAPSEIAEGKLNFRVTNSLAIPNHMIEVDIAGDQFVVTRRDNNKEAIESRGRFSSDELASIWNLIDSIDWKQMNDDDVLGLDGTSYRIRFGEQEYKIWTPEHDTETRKLSTVIEFKTFLWEIAKISFGEQGGAHQSTTRSESKSK